MSRFSYYGSGQRLAFATMFVGFCMCLAGAIGPHWLEANVNADIPFLGSLLEKVNYLKLNLGVWWMCIDFAGTAQCFNMYSGDETAGAQVECDAGFDWIIIVRGAIVINLKLSLLCGLVACCRCMCCSGGKTICHGIFAFVAGGFGFVAVGIMALKKDSLILLSFIDVAYGWSFWVYMIGSGLMVIASLLLCFSVPGENPHGMVMMAPATGPGLHVSVNTSTHSQYELNGQVRNFEPLPEQNVLGQAGSVYPISNA